MADAAGDEADQHLAGPRLGELDLLDDERLAELLEHRGAHLHGGECTLYAHRRMSDHAPLDDIVLEARPPARSGRHLGRSGPPCRRTRGADARRRRAGHRPHVQGHRPRHAEGPRQARVGVHDRDGLRGRPAVQRHERPPPAALLRPARTAARSTSSSAAFEMCHSIPITDRIELHPSAVPLAELLLTKMQIVELNAKDQADILTILYHHDVAETDGGGDVVNGARVAQLCAGDWGLWRTTLLNVERTRDALAGSSLTAEQQAVVSERLERLWSAGRVGVEVDQVEDAKPRRRQGALVRGARGGRRLAAGSRASEARSRGRRGPPSTPGRGPVSCSTRARRWRRVFTWTCSSAAVSCQRQPDERNRSSVSTSREWRRASCSSSGCRSARRNAASTSSSWSASRSECEPTWWCVAQPASRRRRANRHAWRASTIDRAKAGCVGREAADADRPAEALVQRGREARQLRPRRRPTARRRRSRASSRRRPPRTPASARPSSSRVEAGVGILGLAHDRRERRGPRRARTSRGAPPPPAAAPGPAMIRSTSSAARRRSLSRMARRRASSRPRNGSAWSTAARSSSARPRRAGGDHQVGLRPADGDDREREPAAGGDRVLGLEPGDRRREAPPRRRLTAPGRPPSTREPGPATHAESRGSRTSRMLSRPEP